VRPCWLFPFVRGLFRNILELVSLHFFYCFKDRACLLLTVQKQPAQLPFGNLTARNGLLTCCRSGHCRVFGLLKCHCWPLPLQERKASFPAFERIQGLLTMVAEELPDAPLYVSLHDISKTLKCTPPRSEVFRSALVNAGERPRA
jgi:N2,N2-dimethylguanosine tRNA methyltransferase